MATHEGSYAYLFCDDETGSNKNRPGDSQKKTYVFVFHESRKSTAFVEKQ